jgi:NAD(P)-dependent dehydrogenase (short-subunit alcohol dehydrogenase family)
MKMQRSERLAGKVVIVTGAGQGIGAAIARGVCTAGGHAVLTDIDANAAEKSALSLAGIGPETQSAQLDVRDVHAFETLVQRLMKRFGRIDGLVNNAGINVKYEPLSMPDEEWDRCMDVNLRGQWNGCRAVLPAMITRGSGAIVNISSVHGHQIIPGSFPYPVSKSAILGMTRALGVEYAPKGVRINSISPGYVETPLVDQWLASVDDPASVRAQAEALIPARRFARADEVAMTAVFLLSDEASYIVATDIAIDGGRLALFHA